MGRPKLENGFTLVEVLIGLLLLALIGLVITSALQFTGRDYETVRLLNRASRLATSQVEICKEMAIGGDFAEIKADAAGVHPEYSINWAVTNLTIDNMGNPVPANPGDVVFLKDVTISIEHNTRPDISVVRNIRVGPR